MENATMILPKKYMDLDKSVLYVSGLTLKYMFRNKIVKLPILRDFIEDKIGQNMDDVFLAALTMLYGLGKIDYLDKNDTFFLIK